MRSFLLVPLFLPIVTLLGCAAEPPKDVTDPGQLTYLGFVNREVNCSRCHGAEGTGGMFGPKINDIMRRKSRAYVRDVILHGKGEDDDAMPGFAQQLTPEQVEQVLDFLATWVDSLPRPAGADSGNAAPSAH